MQHLIGNGPHFQTIVLAGQASFRIAYTSSTGNFFCHLYAERTEVGQSTELHQPLLGDIVAVSHKPLLQKKAKKLGMISKKIRNIDKFYYFILVHGHPNPTA